MSTEISQVPLSGVLQLLSEARAHGVLSVLDVDVSPSVAVNEACLGSLGWYYISSLLLLRVSDPPPQQQNKSGRA